MVSHLLHRRLPALLLNLRRYRIDGIERRRHQPVHDACDDPPDVRLLCRLRQHEQSRRIARILVFADPFHLPPCDDGAVALRRSAVAVVAKHRPAVRMLRIDDVDRGEDLPRRRAHVRQEAIDQRDHPLDKL